MAYNAIDTSFGTNNSLMDQLVNKGFSLSEATALKDQFMGSGMNDFNQWGSSVGLENAVGSNTSNTDVFGLGKLLDSTGITGPDGQLFGLDKSQQKSLGDLAGLGSGLWNMYSANRNYNMMKDYYGHQMGLQNEQMDRVRKEDARISGMREGLAKNYGGK